MTEAEKRTDETADDESAAVVGVDVEVDLPDDTADGDPTADDDKPDDETEGGDA